MISNIIYTNHIQPYVYIYVSDYTQQKPTWNLKMDHWKRRFLFKTKTPPEFQVLLVKISGLQWHDTPSLCVNPSPNNFGTNKNRGTSMSCSKCIAVKLDTPMAWTTPRLLKSNKRRSMYGVPTWKPSKLPSFVGILTTHFEPNYIETANNTSSVMWKKCAGVSLIEQYARGLKWGER